MAKNKPLRPWSTTQTANLDGCYETHRSVVAGRHPVVSGTAGVALVGDGVAQ